MGLTAASYTAGITMPEKQLESSKRNAFFKDPFFQDLVGGVGDGLEKRLAEFSARSMGLSGAGLGEAAHNIQVSASNDKFRIQRQQEVHQGVQDASRCCDRAVVLHLLRNWHPLSLRSEGHLCSRRSSGLRSNEGSESGLCD